MEEHSFFFYVIPYLFGLGFLFWTETKWLNEELTLPTEGHEVAKIFVVWFLVYLQAFINAGMYLGNCIKTLMELYTKWADSLGFLKRFTFKQLYAICSSILFTKLGIVFWKHVLFVHVCESYYNSCRAYKIGQFATYLKRMICGKPSERKSIICQRYLDHFPLFLFGLFFIFMGHIVLPYLSYLLEKKKLCKRMNTKLKRLEQLVETELVQEDSCIKDSLENNENNNVVKAIESEDHLVASTN